MPSPAACLESVPGWGEIADLYLADVAARCGEPHARNTGYYLRALIARCPRLTLAEVLRYRLERRGEGTSNRTINFAVNAARGCLAWAESTGLIAVNPLPRLRRLPQREADLARERRPLTDEEVDRFLAVVAERDRGLKAPQVPLWRTLIETGMRWGETVALRPEDLAGDELLVRARTAKGKRTRRIPIHPDMVALLRAQPWPDVLFRSPRGFTWKPCSRGSARLRFHRLRERAGIPKRDEEGRTVDIHALRYTACARMLRRGLGPEIVQRILGHRDPAFTLRVYARLHQDDVRAALRKSWGLAP